MIATAVSQFFGSIAAVFVVAGIPAAVLIAKILSDHGTALWKVLFVGFAGGPLLLILFHLVRLPGYHGVCVGMFGDTTPCTFAEFADDEASKLFWLVPIAVVWFLLFWVTYTASTMVRRKSRKVTQLQSVAKQSCDKT